MDGPKGKPGRSNPGKARLDKDGRLARALRENLRKRKDQARSRHGGAEISGNRPENDTDSSEKS